MPAAQCPEPGAYIPEPPNGDFRHFENFRLKNETDFASQQQET